MSRRVVVYCAPTNKRSMIVGRAMYQGLLRHEAHVDLKSSRDYKRPKHDIAIFYGFSCGLRRVFDEYIKAGRTAVYIDLGYWHRKKRTRYDGFHKISINDRHPTTYFQKYQHTAKRFSRLNIPIRPWREKGRHILVVGMSGKGAAAAGFNPQQWERQTIDRLRGLTNRPIHFRPKPNYISKRPIPGSIYRPDETLAEALRDCHAVVCLHSNVAIDAMLAGVPAFCEYGAASAIAMTDLEQIENPELPAGRAQFANDLAFTQWNINEMRTGEPWSHMVRERLL